MRSWGLRGWAPERKLGHVELGYVGWGSQEVHATHTSKHLYAHYTHTCPCCPASSLTAPTHTLTCWDLWALRGYRLVGLLACLPLRLVGLSQLPWGRRSVREFWAVETHSPQKSIYGEVCLGI